MTTGTPPAEVVVSLDLVRALLAEQHPDLASLPLSAAPSGWDYAMYRLGAELAVRLPRREFAVRLIANEQRWLPEIARWLPVAVPAPVRIGRAGCGYPWPWSVVRWIDGESADLALPNNSGVARLGACLRALHRPGPRDGPADPYRGVPLAERSDALDARIARVSESTNRLTPRVLAAWRAAVDAPLAETRAWIHGDLHPRNLITSRGELRGVIDWGDVTIGDPASDLAGIWMLGMDAAARSLAWQAYGELDDATLARARGWAVYFGVTLVDVGLTDDPRHGAVGERTLRALVDDLA